MWFVVWDEDDVQGPFETQTQGILAIAKTRYTPARMDKTPAVVRTVAPEEVTEAIERVWERFW